MVGLKGFQWCYAMYIVQTKPVHKNWRYLQKLMFTATGGITDVPLVVLGTPQGLWGSNMQHTTISLLYMSLAPLNSSNFTQFSHCSLRYVLLSL